MGLHAYVRRFRLPEGRPAPLLVEWSFLAFVPALIGSGTALVLGAPHVFPWPLKPPPAALYGCVFLGSVLFYGHGFFRPTWNNTVPQLLAIAAYDLVLLVPFLGLLPNVLPAHGMSLTVYLVIVGYSLGLSLYFLFLHPATRLFGARPGPGSAHRA